MVNPFEGFQTGLMTGAQLGQRAYKARNRRTIGGRMASGDYAGAANAAYGSGDLESGLALTQYGSQQEEAARNQQIGSLVAGGDYGKAEAVAGKAGDLDGLAQIREWSANASEREIEQARQTNGQIAAVAYGLRDIPDPAQRFAEAQRIAPSFGLDPSQITPDMLTDQGLEVLISQSMSVKDYLDYQIDRDRQNRPIVTPYGIIMPPGADMGSIAEGAEDEWEYSNPNQPARGQPERAQQASVSFQSSQDARRAISQIVPGVTFTSGRRTPAQQRALIDRWERGGRKGVRPADNSYHLQDRAWDLVPPPGMTMAELAQTMRSQGFRALDEGDHVHVSW